MNQTISNRCSAAIGTLRDAAAKLAKSPNSSSNPFIVNVRLEEVGIALNRFCLWVGQNGGFHQPASRLSLERRLQGDNDALERITQLLDHLKHASDEVLRTSSSSEMERSFSESEGTNQNSTDPLDQVRECLSGLFEISSAGIKYSDFVGTPQMAIHDPDRQLSDAQSESNTNEKGSRGSIDGSTLFTVDSRRNSLNSTASLETLTTSPTARGKDSVLEKGVEFTLDGKKAFLESQRQLAISYEDEGRVKESLELRERIVAEWQMIVAEDHPELLEAQRTLSWTYQKSGHLQKALETHEHLAAVWSRISKEDNQDRLEALRQLAILYQLIGRGKESLVVRRQVASTWEKISNEAHPQRLEAQRMLAVALDGDGQLKECLELRKKVAGVWGKISKEDNQDRLEAERMLAISYENSGYHTEALSLRKHIAGVWGRVVEGNHPQRLEAQRMLDVALEYDRRHKEC